MKYARVLNDKVIETFVPISGFSIDQCFVPSIAMQFIPVDDSVEVGDDYTPPAIIVEEPVEEESVTEEPAAEEPIEEPTV